MQVTSLGIELLKKIEKHMAKQSDILEILLELRNAELSARGVTRDTKPLSAAATKTRRRA